MTDAIQPVFKLLAQHQMSQKEAIFKAIRAEFATGNVPLSAEANKLLAGLPLWDMLELFEEHPGFSAEDKLTSLATALRLFRQAEKDLLAALTAFHDYCLQPSFMAKSTAAEAENLEAGVRKELFAFAALAHSVMDHCRALRKKLGPADFAAQAAQYFGSTGIHDFVVGLRNALHHQRMVGADWNVRTTPTEKTSRFVLKTRDLLRVSDWNVDAKKFIDGFGKQIDVRVVVEDYAPRVHAFYAWFIPAVEALAGVPLEDYRTCLRKRRALAAAGFWRLLLDFAVRGKIDPYAHIQKSLTPEQHAAALTLPAHSKEQVEYLIACIDEHGACDCDEALRSLAYALFSVEQAAPVADPGMLAGGASTSVPAGTAGGTAAKEVS